MCGRYSLLDLSEFVALFPWVAPPEKFAPRYNIAPSQPILALTNRKGGTLEHLIWGFVPAWAKPSDEVKSMINARAETVASRPAFRGSLRHKRCVIPASGFYEWRKTPRGKQPFYITLSGKHPMLFAGLWEDTPDGGGGEVRTACIITTAAAESVADIHDRMPAILTPKQATQWIKTPDIEAEGLTELLRPYTGRLQNMPVGRAVNSPANDRPECIEPLTAEDESGSAPGLFG